MDKDITYIGLDVHKDTIAVALAADGRGEVCAHGQISNTPAALTRLSSKLSRNGFEQNGLKQGDYGTANNIATARGISVESVKHAGIVESQAGKVRILRRDELDAEWEPDADGHLTVWECCQHLVRLHEKHGIGYETAVMLKKFGSDKAEAVKDLAYILYDLCANKRQDAKEATAYNALIADWSDLTREAAVAPLSNRSGQMRFEV